MDRKGQTVFSYSHGGIWAGYRAPDGQIVMLTANQCFLMDRAGKIRTTFVVQGGSWTSGLDLLPRGHVLVSETTANKVAEFDAQGKRVWEADAPQITTATHLRNGNTLVASHSSCRAFELDRKGKVVWEHTDALHVFRARRR